MEKRRTFRTDSELFHADTCEPLKQAANLGALRMAALGRGNYPGTRLPANDLTELCMAGFWDAPGPQDWGLDWHCNEGIEIGWLSAGRLPFHIDGKSLLVEPGSLTIARPWQRHRVGDPHVPASHYSWIILDVGVRRPNQPWRWPKWMLFSQNGLLRLTDMLRQNEEPVWCGDRRIGECFSGLDTIVTQGSSDSNLALLKIVTNELIVLLASLLESRKPHLDASLYGSERTVRLFLEALPARLDEPWTLEMMAEECGIGRTQFASLCRRIVNVPPVEFLNHQRLDAAATLLESEPHTPITDVAFRCGFQSSQYFAKAFRKHHGYSPRAHRQAT